jgi:3-mercaptopyruvate sulfurtransferase SseA
MMDSGRRDVFRLMCMLIGFSILGLATNALSQKPVPVFSSTGPGAWPDRSPRITAEELRSEWARGKAILLLDVRSTPAYLAGHSGRALHAPAPEFLDSYRRLGLQTILKAADEVAILCEGEDCSSGDRIHHVLRALGHSQEIRVLDGGWPAYRRAGLE